MNPGSPKQPFPNATTITGTLHSTPSTNGFRIEFFGSNADPANGIAEGQMFLDSTGAISGLGFTTVNTDANGNASFTVTVPVAPGQRVTATATDPNGNTSEFSAGLEVSPPPPSPPGPPPLPPPPFVSVAISPFGEVLEVVSPAGMLTQYSAFGVQVLGTGVRSASVAFSPTAGEVLDVIFQDGSLVQFDAAGKHVLGKLF